MSLTINSANHAVPFKSRSNQVSNLNFAKSISAHDTFLKDNNSQISFQKKLSKKNVLYGAGIVGGTVSTGIGILELAAGNSTASVICGVFAALSILVTGIIDMTR